MLTVDLGHLFRTGGHEIDVDVDPGRVDWEGADALPAGPLKVRLHVRPAGRDVVARGEVAGTVEGECRRCLKPARRTVSEDVSLVFRRDAEPDDPDAYSLPERGTTLDLWPAVREQWLLAAPSFLECESPCRGLCPRCGADLDEEDCGCEVSVADERWRPLLALAGEGASAMNDEVADGRTEEEGLEAEKA